MPFSIDGGAKADPGAGLGDAGAGTGFRRGGVGGGGGDDGVGQLRTPDLQQPTAGGWQKGASSCHAD